jgi:hypothetical protein
MLHIVLFLLKIIGIILASILGLLLFLILVVLLVPIRYRINADNKDEIRAEAKISWFLRLIYIRIIYSDNQMIIKLRLFGKIFYDSSNLKEKRQSKKPGKLTKFRKPLKKSGTRTEIKTKKTVKVQTEIKPKVITKTQQDIKSTDVVKAQRNEGQTDVVKTQRNESQTDVVKIQKNINTTDVIKIQKDTNLVEIDKIQQNKTLTEVNKAQKEVKAAEITESKDQIIIDYTETFSENPEVLDEDMQSKKKKGIFSKVKRFFHKIKEFFIKLKNWFLGLKKRILNLKEKIFTIGEKWNRIKAFLKDDKNKKALSKSFKTVKRILKHIRPTRLKLELEFGTGDPCSTGQALGVFAMFYGYYGKSMQITPNFEDEILKGSIFCIGRIRLFTLLIICIKLILDKNFRNLLKNFKTLKEDL